MTTPPINNKLLNKAILVIGNDSAVIKNLIIQLAQKGANVALICWKMQLDSIIKIKLSVEESGKRFLLIEQAKTMTFNSQELVNAITAELGPLDAIIDMSGQVDPVQRNSHQLNPWLLKPSWPTTQAVLKAMTQA